MRRQILIAAAVTSLSSGSLFAQPASSLSEDAKEFVSFDAKTIALTHVQLVDGTGAAPKKDQTIVIKDGEIAAVGQSSQVSIPEDADVLDLKGHTVIPGIVGLHDHTFYTTNRREAQMNTSSPRLYLASGVTTIRTTGSFSPYSEINMKRSIEDGESVGPRMHITGPYISGPAPGRAGATMAQVSTPDDARRVVAYWASSRTATSSTNAATGWRTWTTAFRIFPRRCFASDRSRSSLPPSRSLSRLPRESFLSTTTFENISPSSEIFPPR